MGRVEIRMAGFGGQGIVLAGNIIGQAAAIYDNKFATFTQNYGPESRGGSCTAEVLASDEPINYPYVLSPNLVIVFSQEAYTKYGRNNAPGSIMIIDSDLVKPDPSHNPPPFAIPATQMARETGKIVVANIIMLGFLAAVSDVVSPRHSANPS